MNYTSNISEIVSRRIKTLEDLKNPDLMLRRIADAVLPELRKRVHVDGKATDGGQIGTYSPGYMVLRTGTYKNADTFKKGKNVGKNKNSGVSTATGKARPIYNRSADTKVILSLTRQMENDLSTSPTPNGYGIGYKNSFNYDKSQWNEKTYNKPIWSLSQTEHAITIKEAEDYITEQFNAS